MSEGLKKETVNYMTTWDTVETGYKGDGIRVMGGGGTGKSPVESPAEREGGGSSRGEWTAPEG